MDDKEFWEKCGFTSEIDKGRAGTTTRMGHNVDTGKSWMEGQTSFEPLNWKDPTGIPCREPDLDLNNLFKYAVPKIKAFVMAYMMGDCEDDKPFCATVWGNLKDNSFTKVCDKDPATALRKAIEQVWEEK